MIDRLVEAIRRIENIEREITGFRTQNLSLARRVPPSVQIVRTRENIPAMTGQTPGAGEVELVGPLYDSGGDLDLSGAGSLRFTAYNLSGVPQDTDLEVLAVQDESGQFWLVQQRDPESANIVCGFSGQLSLANDLIGSPVTPPLTWGLLAVADKATVMENMTSTSPGVMTVDYSQADPIHQPSPGTYFQMLAIANMSILIAGTNQQVDLTIGINGVPPDESLVRTSLRTGGQHTAGLGMAMSTSIALPGIQEGDTIAAFWRSPTGASVEVLSFGISIQGDPMLCVGQCGTIGGGFVDLFDGGFLDPRWQSAEVPGGGQLFIDDDLSGSTWRMTNKIGSGGFERKRKAAPFADFTKVICQFTSLARDRLDLDYRLYGQTRTLGIMRANLNWQYWDNGSYVDTGVQWVSGDAVRMECTRTKSGNDSDLVRTYFVNDVEVGTSLNSPSADPVSEYCDITFGLWYSGPTAGSDVWEIDAVSISYEN